MLIFINKPSWRNARKISKAIRIHNQKNPNMLERMPKDIKKSDFWIAQNEYFKILGFIGIFSWGEDGVEIVSHLTLEKFRDLGVGEKLLEYAMTEARKISSKIFLFTTEIEYYEKFRFEVVEAEKFPEKIRVRCQNCPNGPFGPGFSPCLEKAMEQKVKPSESNTWMFPYFG